MRITLTIIAILFFYITVCAQKFSPERFFPHKLGDKWEYDYPGSNPRLSIEEVTEDSLAMDSSVYIDINKSKSFGWQYRIDKHNNIFYLPEYKAGNFLLYKLNSELGDIWQENPNRPGSHVARLEEEFPSIVFGVPTVIKKISYYANEGLHSWLETRYLAAGFGLILLTAEASPYDYVKKLVGCRIDGQRYGTLVDVRNTNSQPLSFKLYQNYPNPFNPITTIDFELPEYGLVDLKVYNLLGAEISTIIKEYKTPGKYTVKLNAEGLTSGIYFYKLTTSNNWAIKKMNIIK